jgi:hypothetical protein
MANPNKAPRLRPKITGRTPIKGFEVGGQAYALLPDGRWVIVYKGKKYKRQLKSGIAPDGSNFKWSLINGKRVQVAWAFTKGMTGKYGRFAHTAIAKNLEKNVS